MWVNGLTRHYALRLKMTVEMVCEPINCVRLYHSNILVSSGAIKALKKALEHLARMCFDEGFALPPELILNFDNCGENKKLTGDNPAISEYLVLRPDIHCAVAECHETSIFFCQGINNKSLGRKFL